VAGRSGKAQPYRTAGGGAAGDRCRVGEVTYRCFHIIEALPHGGWRSRGRPEPNWPRDLLISSRHRRLTGRRAAEPREMCARALWSGPRIMV
jgi:hypothetical protein